MRENGHFRTMDAYVSAYLTMKGFNHGLVNDGPNKYTFLFDASPDLYEEITNYNNGANVEASRFASTIKLLKGEIFSMRKDKESDRWNGNNPRTR